MNELVLGVNIDKAVLDLETLIFDLSKYYNLHILHNYNENKWSNLEMEKFRDLFLNKLKSDGQLISGFKEAFYSLKKMNVKIIGISSLGLKRKQTPAIIQKILTKNGIIFDKVYFKMEDTLKLCKYLEVDMLVDDLKTCNILSDLKTLDKGEDGAYLKAFTSWSSIVEFIVEKQKITKKA